MNKNKPDPGRRLLLKYVAAGLGGTALGLPVILRTPPTGAFELDQLLASLKAVGREYLVQYPGERSRSALLERLGNGISPATDRSGSIVWENLMSCVRNDFKNDNVVFLNGWAFARSEARLYALAVV